VIFLPKLPYTHRIYVCMYDFGQPYSFMINNCVGTYTIYLHYHSQLDNMVSQEWGS
jgi:hypothetical protein